MLGAAHPCPDLAPQAKRSAPGSAPLPQAAGTGAHEAATCEFKLVGDRASFDALEGDWNVLFARAGRDTQVFQTFGWNWHWCNHYLGPTPGKTGAPALAVVTGRRDGRLVMVWPLVSARAHGLRTVAWMGEPVSQYGDILMEDCVDAGALLRQAWHFVESAIAPDLVRLRKVRADAAVAPLLAELGALATLRQQAPYLDLASAESFSAYEQRYSARARRNRHRLARRLADRGAMAFERQHDGARARELAELAIRLKRDWLKQRGLLSPALSDPRTGGFFADIAEGASHPAGCEVSAVTCGEEAAAIEINVRCKARTVLHVIVFNLKYESAGAGTLILEDTISRACDNGLRTFDLLAPADDYKLDWADAAVEVTDWALPMSLTGRLYARLYLGFARKVIKGALAALPLPLRRALAARFLH